MIANMKKKEKKKKKKTKKKKKKKKKKKRKEKEKMKSHTHMADFFQEYPLMLFIPAQSCSSSACACWVSSLWADYSCQHASSLLSLVSASINGLSITQYAERTIFFFFKNFLLYIWLSMHWIKYMMPIFLSLSELFACKVISFGD